MAGEITPDGPLHRRRPPVEEVDDRTGQRDAVVGQGVVAREEVVLQVGHRVCLVGLHQRLVVDLMGRRRGRSARRARVFNS